MHQTYKISVHKIGTTIIFLRILNTWKRKSQILSSPPFPTFSHTLAFSPHSSNLHNRKMAIPFPKRSIRILVPVFPILFLLYILIIVRAQFSIPAKYDGFVYKNRPTTFDSVIIEAFFDPVCPDSRDSWPPLKQALHYYAPLVSLIVHPFALPYHDNSYVTSRALHIVNEINSSATYDLLELFFKHQEEFYNERTFSMSKASIVDLVTKFASKALGSSYYSVIQSGFRDRRTDLTTRVSFKYGCSRGVFGTPFFFVNGFLLPDAGSALDYTGWRKVIDPLVSKQGSKKGGSTFLSMKS